MMKNILAYRAIGLLRNRSFVTKIIFLLACLSLLCLSVTAYLIVQANIFDNPEPIRIISWVLLDLVILLFLAIFLVYNVVVSVKNTLGSKLQKRVILTFSLIVAVPTIIIAVFSVYFFNSGLQVWFDKKITTVLEQSISVAHTYISEHKLKLKESAITITDDLAEMYNYLMHDPTYFTKTLNAEAEMRGLDEAMVFDNENNMILAQTRLSFSLGFLSIPAHNLEQAKNGEVIEIASPPNKIRMLIKLPMYSDAYLVVGKLIDSTIISHIDEINGAANSYTNLKSNIAKMQIKFSVIFCIIVLLLMIATVGSGIIFASQIVTPILRLLSATDKVRQGDLTIQVLEKDLQDDEIKLLSLAFNHMVSKLYTQQKDLLIAQRAAAWADVARRVAHEIKNPLTPIQLAAQRLDKKFRHEITSDIEAYDRYIKIIIRHTNDIQKIVTEFVNFARLSAPSFKKLELVSLIKEMVMARKVINENVEYQFFSSVENIDFVCDLTQMQQIITNLLKNAEESIASSSNNPLIKVLITHDNYKTIIEVVDSGIGFTADLITKATDAYTTTSTQGMGLGLAIVKKITEDHFGFVEIINNNGCGATIRLVFDTKKLNNRI